MQEREPPPGTRPAPGTFSALLQDLAHLPTPEGEATPVVPGSGEKVGRFEVVREIGRGGFGVVLEARDPVVGRRVAVKLVRPGRSAERPGSPSFEEAEAVGRLSHPNIVQLFDVGTADSGPYLVFELLRGEPLSKRLDRGPLPPAEATRMALEVAKGLAHAHGSAVVHRDLKPSNVFLCEDGQVKVLDFGLALVFGKRRTIEGGTPGWMAPEQRVGAPEDERTDVWALGAILFRALAGRDPARARLEIPEAPELEALVERMLAPDPVKRSRDAKAVVEALEPIVRRLEAAGAPVTARVRRRMPRALRAAPLVLAIAAIVLATYLLVRGEPTTPSGLAVADFAIADFANETHEPELDTLSDLLITALEQPTEPRLHVLTRSRMLEVLNQLGKKGDRIDELQAREVGRRTGTRALLLATIRKLGGSYVVDMRALDPVKDVYLFTSSQRAPSQEAIFDLVDRLAGEARRWATAATVPFARPLATLTTSNPKAWNALAQARRAWDRLDHDETERLLKVALAEDPGFALARYLRAMLWYDGGYESHGSPPLYLADHLYNRLDGRGFSVREDLQEIEKLPGLLPEKERLTLLAKLALHEGAWGGMTALRLQDELASAFPLDKEAVFYAGDVRLHQNEAGASIPYFERALQLDPEYAPALDHLAYAILQTRPEQHLDLLRRWAADGRNGLLTVVGLLAAGKEREGLDLLQRRRKGLQDLSPEDFVAWALPGYRVFQGRAPDVERVVRDWLDRTSPDDQPWRHLGRTNVLALSLAAQGRFAEARVRFDDYRPVRRPRAEPVLQLWLASASGAPGALRAAAARAEQAGVPEHPAYVGEALVALADAGDIPTAGRFATKALAGPNGAELAQVDRRLAEALAAWAGNRLDVAEASLRALADHTDVYIRYLGMLLLGELAQARGDCAGTVAALEGARGLRYADTMNIRFWSYPGLLNSLALCQERLGDLRTARERNDEMLELWERADPELPLLAEANAMRARLAAAR